MYFDHEKRIVYQKSIEMESAATLDGLAAVGAFPLDEIAPGKALMFPVVKMLSQMTERQRWREKNLRSTEAGMPLRIDNKSKSKNLDYEYVCEKVRKVGMSLIYVPCFPG